jgi:hypothetical protein
MMKHSQLRWIVQVIVVLVTIIPLVFWATHWVWLAPESLIGSAPCAPPCWHGVVPGETGKQEAVTIVGALPFVSRSSLTVSPSPWEQSTEVIKARYKGVMLNRTGLYANVKNDHVTWLVVDMPRRIRLSRALQLFGEPERYNVVQNPDQSLYYGFFFPDKGLYLTGSLSFQPSNLVTSTLEGRIQIFRAEYFPVMDFSRFLAEIRGFPEEAVQSIADHYPAWPGLGAEVQVRPVPTATPKDTMWWKEGLETVAAQRTVSPAETR